MESGSRDHTAPLQRSHLLLRLLPRADGGAVRVGAVPRLRDDPQLLAPLRDLPHQVPELLGQHQHTPGRGGRKNVAGVDLFILYYFPNILFVSKLYVFSVAKYFCSFPNIFVGSKYSYFICFQIFLFVPNIFIFFQIFLYVSKYFYTFLNIFRPIWVG